MNRSGTDNGFNLVELMLVVAIMGIIVSIAIATYSFSISHARSIACHSNQRILTDAASVYLANEGHPPADIEDLRPYANTFDTVITCPSDHAVLLEWDADEEEVVCPLHP